MAAQIKQSKVNITPFLDVAPGFGTGSNNPGYPTEYQMGYTGDGYDHCFWTYQGDATPSGSQITAWTITDTLGNTFTDPTGCDFIRIVVERIADSATPDVANPVLIAITGPGLPEIAETCLPPYELVIYQPRTTLTADFTSSSHFSVAVPSANVASILVTAQIGFYKPSV
mgnify:CR=1 FL=1